MEDRHYHRQVRHSATNYHRGSKFTVPHETAIRLLCHTDTASGVIGWSGTFIKHLEWVTGAKIQLQKTIPNCHERVVNVTGNTRPDRRVFFEGEEWNVSQVQEALLRVFERVLELEWNDSGFVGCRLLAGFGQLGGVIGERGNVITKLEKSCGTKIRILPPDLLPDCAFPGDELIQIMGEAVAVKKSLVAVAWRLQVKQETEEAPKGISSYDAFPNSVNHSSVARPLSAENDRILYSQEDSSWRIVVFRFLCSVDTAGGVIGSGGKLVKALEEETGASIKFSDSVVTCRERIVTISALECPEPLFSPAQIAVVRVFDRSIEVSNERGPVSVLDKGKTITARLLVASNEVSCLVNTEGKISSDISTVTGVQMQLLGGTPIGTCSTEKDDNVLQIIGLYENVKSALFQVTGRLRDNLYSDIVSDGAEPMHNPYSANPNISPYEREKAAFPGSGHLSEISPIDHDMAPILEMEQLGLLCKPVNGEDMTSVADTAGELATSEGGLEQGSVEPAVLTNSKEEFEIPEQIFDCVYGTDGSNLARMKQISGASITVEDPCPDKSFGKVIISGTLDRIQIACSLLQAFILPEL